MTRVHIMAGSVYGNAQNVAEEAEQHLTSLGVDCEVFSDPEVSDFTSADILIVITSTTGSGDIPPNLEMVYEELRSEFPLLTDKPFAVAALGDSSYGETFCGGGKHFFELLTELQAKPIVDMLEVDAIETLEPERDVINWLDTFKDKLLGLPSL